MTLRRWRYGVAGLLVACGAAVAATDDMGSRVEAAVKRHPISGARVGVCVRRLDDSVEIAAIRESESLEIASNAKLFTTAAALGRLGGEYRFRTWVVANGAVGEGALTGDLAVVGGGDPALSGRFYGGDVLRVPRDIAQAVQAAGIRTITGDLVMNDGFFDREYRAPNWPDDVEALWWYVAPVSALSFNDNCVRITVKAARTAGDPPTISLYPDVGIMRTANAATTSSTSEKGIQFRRRADGVIEVGGSLRAGRTVGEDITVDAPPLFLGAAIRSELAKAGVRLQGTVRLARPEDVLRANPLRILVIEHTLVEAVTVANQRSQNFFAEMILKTLGAERRKRGSFANGLAEVMAFAQEAGADAGVRLADGSGLSPGNCAAPRAIVQLLAAMRAGPLGDVFEGSLAAPGDAETSLRYRLDGARGRMRAKTGTIKSRGVSALAGYLHPRSGGVYAFSVIVNDMKPSQTYAAKVLEDAVCAAVLGIPDPALKSNAKGKTP